MRAGKVNGRGKDSSWALAVESFGTRFNHTDVNNGIARSLNMVEIQFHLKKPAEPQVTGPPDNLGGP